MKLKSNDFMQAVRVAVNDAYLQAAIATSTTNSDNKRQETMFVYGRARGERMRQQAAEAKRRALRRLPDLLERAEANMLANGLRPPAVWCWTSRSSTTSGAWSRAKAC
jgi:L-lactate utilization protein LutB